MSKSCNYLGIPIFEEGHLLVIPEHAKEIFAINEGDAIEIYVEGDRIFLKPRKKYCAYQFPGRNKTIEAGLLEEQSNEQKASAGVFRFFPRLVQS